MPRRGLLALVVLALSALLVIASLSSGCGRLKKKRDCKEFSQKICEKWFDCWPLISEGYWGSEEDCRLVIEPVCNTPEGLEECHIDGDMLDECNDGLDGSACGRLPEACLVMVDCVVQ